MEGSGIGDVVGLADGVAAAKGIAGEAEAVGSGGVGNRLYAVGAEGIRAGVARLVGTTEQRIFDEAMRLLSSPSAYAAMAGGQNPYGDGTAACRIADLLEQVPTTSALTLLEPRDPARETFAAAKTAP